MISNSPNKKTLLQHQTKHFGNAQELRRAVQAYAEKKTTTYIADFSREKKEGRKEVCNTGIDIEWHDEMVRGINYPRRRRKTQHIYHHRSVVNNRLLVREVIEQNECTRVDASREN